MLVELTINELSPGGEGVGICEIDGERRAVFVPNVVSGEVVKVEVQDPKRRPMRGRVVSILTSSPSRVSPACPYVDRCGGCDWMHLATNEQVAEHGRMLARVLRLPSSSTVVVTHGAPRALGYRSRARVHLESKRSGKVVVGMFGRRSHEPAAVDACVVLDPILERARVAIERWLAGARGKGEAKLSLGAPPTTHIAVRRAVIDVMWSGDLPAEVFGRLEQAVLAKDGEIAGARVFAGAVRVPAKIGDPTPYIMGADDVPLRLGPGGFSQATEEGNVLLAKRVDAIVAGVIPVRTAPLIELYSGAANLTVLLARHGEVIAVESDREACGAARENLSARGLSSAVKIVEGDAATFSIPKGTEIVVLDPPREGARAVATTLAERRHKRPTIVYVSCDPPTLARDVEILVASGYRLDKVETFEMFPQTSHVETLVVLVP